MQSSAELASGVRRRVRATVMLLLLGGSVSCKNDPAPADGAPAVSRSAASKLVASAVAADAPAPAPTSAASAAATTEAGLGAPPESFSSGEKVEVTNAVGLGCEARSSQGWLQLLCRKKNGTGGRPVRAIRDLAAYTAQQANPDAAPSENAPSEKAEPNAAEGDSAEPAAAGLGELPNVIEPDEQGELRVPVPWRAGHTAKLRVEWTDTSYDLEVDGTAARLVLPVSLGLRRQCEALRKESQAVVDAAEKGTDATGLNRSDVAKLPRFGMCQTAGLGAWSVQLQKLEAAGATPARVVHATFEVAHVDPDGKVQRAPFGTLAFAPQGLQAKPLMVYDYDDDGQQELIVRYDIVKSTEAGAKVPAVYTLRGGEVRAYDKLEPMGPGGVAVEQLDYDMRPDLADFGPYVAWLSSDCGAKLCPDRISGPQFFAYSEKDGTFSRTHSAALGALKRACPKTPDPIVVTQGDGVNAARTAQQVACAKVWKVDDLAVSAAIEAERSKLCSGVDDCPLYRTLKAWAAVAPPATL